MLRTSLVTLPRIAALAGLSSALVASVQEQWVLGSAAAGLGLTLGAIAWPRSRNGRIEVLAEVRTPATPKERLQDRLSRELAAGDALDRIVSELLGQGRVALLMRPDLSGSLREQHLQAAREVLDETMSLVPAGQVLVNSRWVETGNEEVNTGRTLVAVEPLFLDRYAVTNRDYQQFVDAGAYLQMELWDRSIWPAMVEFVDQTKLSGPRFWRDGTYDSDLADHPVVGVNWYEATAYARWAGKRLPGDPEWIKAGAWPVDTGGVPQQRRYPWGEVFDRSLANLFGSQGNATAPVDAFPRGASVGGIYQLVGNVWEWTSTPWGAWEPQGKRAETSVPMRSLRGGAFDTYFESQATCQFQSGDDPLARRHNVGFRCALSWSDVFGPDDAQAAA
jgi:iron(II)-dependent oxidoreductase